MRVNLVVQLPTELWGAVQRLARENGVLTEQFLATAAAEKVGALTDAKAYFEAQAARADLLWFDRFMARKTGQSPDADRH